MIASDYRGYAAELSELARRLEDDGLIEQGTTLRELAFGLDVLADEADEEERVLEAEAEEERERIENSCGVCGADFRREGHQGWCDQRTDDLIYDYEEGEDYYYMWIPDDWRDKEAQND